MKKIYLENSIGDPLSEIVVGVSPNLVEDPLPNAFEKFYGIQIDCQKCYLKHTALYKFTRQGIHDDGPREIYTFWGMI